MIIEKNINTKLGTTLLTYFSLIVLGSVILVLSAKTKVPFYPVPMTMQTFVIMLFGFIFGWKKACLIISAYLLEGAVGLPVFAGTPAYYTTAFFEEKITELLQKSEINDCGRCRLSLDRMSGGTTRDMNCEIGRASCRERV